MWSGTVDLAEAASAARAAVEELEQLGAAPGLRSFALASLVRADLFAGNGFDREAAQRALELETAPVAVDDRVVFKLGQWLRYVDDFDAAGSSSLRLSVQPRTRETRPRSSTSFSTS